VTTTTPAAKRAECNGTHTAFEGIRCEMPARHPGLCRSGQFTGRIVFWSTTWDLCTRAELVVEWAQIDPDVRGAAENFIENVGPARQARGIRLHLISRAALILETLYFPSPDELDQIRFLRGGATTNPR